MQQPSLMRRAGAEAIGAYGIVAAGCGAIMVNTLTGSLGHVGVALTFGLTVAVMIAATGHLSGAHFNPAVTVAMILDKRTTPVEGAGYIAAQVIGAIGAAAIVLVAVNQAAVTAGVTAPGEGITDLGALIIEIAMTAGFLAVILAATKRAPALAALAIPLTLVAIHFASATLSGASVNPARSIGSALVGGDVTALWIYLVGPTIGGIVGWGIWKAVDGGADPADV